MLRLDSLVQNLYTEITLQINLGDSIAHGVRLITAHHTERRTMHGNILTLLRQYVRNNE